MDLWRSLALSTPPTQPTQASERTIIVTIEYYA